MKLSLCFLLTTFALCITNDRPIIGILSQKEKNEDYSYIAASYVKFIESAGARVVPIICNSTTDQLTKLFDSINGVLFPGGGASLSQSHYYESAKTLYQLAKETFDKRSDYFPLWGTCLGFELLCVLQHGSNEILSKYDADDYSIPLNITPGISDSRLLNALNNVRDWLSSEPITFNNHIYGVNKDWFVEDWRLRSFFNVLSTNDDRKGKTFVSMIEAFQYPIYGSQWHPEKAIFEWTTHESINHSYHAVLATQTVANFFVAEARKNNHQFTSQEEEMNALIYNYEPVYSGKNSSSFEQIYKFPCC